VKAIQNILVPIDLSDISDPCLVYALELSKKLHAWLHLLHAVHEPVEASGFSTPHVSMDRVHEETKGRMERQIRLYAASHLGGLTNFVTEVRIGPPHTVIVQYAEEKDIDLIIMGERRKGKLAHALSQKTTHKVLENSGRPILRLIVSD
jgi:nucleotide-binding universal stress UspA family protein